MHEKYGWIVWNFEYKPPHFENEDLALSVRSLQFANVYHVTGYGGISGGFGFPGGGLFPLLT